MNAGFNGEGPTTQMAMIKKHDVIPKAESIPSGISVIQGSFGLCGDPFSHRKDRTTQPLQQPEALNQLSTLAYSNAMEGKPMTWSFQTDAIISSEFIEAVSNDVIIESASITELKGNKACIGTNVEASPKTVTEITPTDFNDSSNILLTSLLEQLVNADEAPSATCDEEISDVDDMDTIDDVSNQYDQEESHDNEGSILEAFDFTEEYVQNDKSVNGACEPWSLPTLPPALPSISEPSQAESLQHINVNRQVEHRPKYLSTQQLLNAMEQSQKSQQQIYDWDKKMGLRISHSKTMRQTRRSRKKLQDLYGWVDPSAVKKKRGYKSIHGRRQMLRNPQLGRNVVPPSA